MKSLLHTWLLYASLLGAISICISQSAQAVIVDLSFSNSSSSSSSGTITEIANTLGTNNGPTAVLGYTVSGLTIDSTGVEDDSISFEFLMAAIGSTASGQPASGMGTIGSAIGVNSADTPTVDDPSQMDLVGESISYALNSQSVTLGSGVAQTGTIEFIGFTAFELNAFFGNDRFNLTGTSADQLGLDAVPSIDPTSGFSISFSDAASGGGFRIGQVDARFEVLAVPEPTGAGLCCLGAMGYIYRRRRPAPVRA